jgi:integrase
VREDEEARLLASCGPYLRPVIITALHTGFRKSELLSLTWGHVDFRHRLITVEAADAKNGEARSVLMTAVLTETLKASRINAAPTAPVFRPREGQSYRDIATAFGTVYDSNPAEDLAALALHRESGCALSARF